MSFFSCSVCTVALVLAAAVSVEARAEAETPPQACYSGAYRFADGGFVVISPSDEGALRYRVSDGRIGKLYPDDDKHFHGGPGWASREPRIADAAFDGCSGDRCTGSGAGRYVRRGDTAAGRGCSPRDPR